MPETLKVSCWHGRRSADPGTIHCAQNGWAEQTWERDADGQWSLVAMTLRPVIGLTWSETGDVQATLGTPREVAP